MTPIKYKRFITFLKEELAISADSINFAERTSGVDKTADFVADLISFPMILWQYGLVTLEQLNRIFDWLAETA